MKNLRKNFTVGSGLLTLLALVALPAQSVFAQCTTSAWSSTTGTVAAIGSETNPAGLPYEGTCGLTVNASNAPAHVTTSAPNNEKLLLTRFYLYPAELNLSSGDAEIFRARGNGSPQVTLELRTLGDGLGLVTNYRSGGSLIQHNQIIPLRSVWQAINVNWSSDGVGGGSVIVKIDGRQQFIINNLDNADEFISNVDLGMVSSVSGSGTLVFDGMEARRANPEPGLLTVNELDNISTRAPVSTGQNAVVAGFVIDGDTEKCVVIRGRGPSMNVTEPRMANPTLTLRASGDPTVLAFNDDWQDDPEAALISQLGSAPPNSLESAIYTCLEPGAYTADLRRDGNSALGLGIVEVLDSDVGTAFLSNISTRSRSFEGGERVIAGLIIAGDEPREVLIRGRGPSVGVSDQRLGDPTIDLRSGPNQIGFNDDWQDDNGAAIQATGFAPPNGTEAAILTTLDPGAYTVILSSGNSTPGIGIIEVFDRSGSSVSQD